MCSLEIYCEIVGKYNGNKFDFEIVDIWILISISTYVSSCSLVLHNIHCHGFPW